MNQSTHNFPAMVKSRPPVSAVWHAEQQLPLLHLSVEGHWCCCLWLKVLEGLIKVCNPAGAEQLILGMSALTFLPNMCVKYCLRKVQKRALQPQATMFCVSSRLPNLLFGAAKLKVLRASHFYCAVLICLPGSLL